MSSVLVVDHDRVVTRLLELTLRSHGHDVVTAVDISAAYDHLDASWFDAVIIDVFLPDGSGLDVVRHVRERLELDVPLVVLSGQRQAAIAARAIESGATCYLIKPFSPRALLAEVARVTEVAPAIG